MASERISTSSGGSCDSTVVGTQSALPSPGIPSNEGQSRASIDTQTSSFGSAVSPMSSIDPQYAPRNDAPGWPRLARLMTKTPALSAHPRFSEMHIRSLFYYQAELRNLERDIIAAEHSRGVETQNYRRLAEEANSEYHGLIMKSRKLLREYDEALLQYTQLCQLPKPESFNLRALRWCLASDDDGRFDVRDMKGPDKTWGDPAKPEEMLSLRTHLWFIVKALVWTKPPVKAQEDLVTTHPQEKIDGLTKWVIYYLVPFWWSLQERRHNQGRSNDEEKAKDNPVSGVTEPEPAAEPEPTTLETFSEATALRLTSALSTVVACLIPVIAIAVLTQVSGTRNLLLCITGFAIMFAILLIMLTQGTTSRTEIFAATAAFSAVLVVFISQPDINIKWPSGAETPVINM